MKVLKFLLMVAAGLLVVTLLTEERGGRNVVDVVGTRGDSGGGSMKLDGEGDKDITVALGKTTIRVREPIEGPNGTTIEREVRRVTFLEGIPGDDGNFQTTEPFVEMLDRERDGDDGLPLVIGTIRSDRASFMMGDAVGGNVQVDLSAVSPERYSLIGSVHGEFYNDDGTTTTFDTSRVDVDGPLLVARAAFTIANAQMTMRGVGLHWNQNTGELLIDESSEFESAPTELAVGWTLVSPGGLDGVLDPEASDARATAVFEMKGPVTGTTSDGGHFGGDTLDYDGPARTITFQDNAFFERDLENEHMRLDAAQVIAKLPEREPDPAENVPALQTDVAVPSIDRLDARGDVTIVSSTLDALPSWLWAPTLSIENGIIRSPDIVRWEVDGILTEGRDLTHRLDDGDLLLAGPTTMTVESGDLAGLEAFAPGGMVWSVPPARDADTPREIAGEMRGGVTGSLADGTTFAGKVLRVDGPSRIVTLEENVVVEKNTQRVDADRLVAAKGPGDEGVTTITALGDVKVVGTPGADAPADASTTNIVTNELSMTGDVATSPGVVTIVRGDLTVTGVDLTWNDATGRLQIARDAHLVDVTPRLDADGELVDAHTDILAVGGLDWTIPPNAVSAFDEGHGVLFGPVSGHTSDGVVLDAGLVDFDGPERTITLRHDARLETVSATGEVVVTTSDHIVATRIDDGTLETLPLHRIESETSITIARADMTLRGIDVSFDELARVLTIAIDPEIETRDTSGSIDFWLRGKGTLTWTLPADPDAPFMEGRGRIAGPEVVGGTNDGLTFGGTALEMGPGLRDLDLIGPGWVQQRVNLRDDRVDARDRIALVRNGLGDIETIDARGAVVAKLVDGVATTDTSSESLLIDRTRRRTILSGSPRLARVGTDGSRIVTAERDIIAETNFADELQQVDAKVGVTMTTGDIRVFCDDMSWDVPGDLAILRGSCLVDMSGIKWSASEILLQPEAQEVESRETGLTLDENR